MKTLAFSQGYDRGNYGNAYESQDWDSWYADQCEDIPSESLGEPLDRSEYEAGMILGFFSSYEIHEISDDAIAEEVIRLRAKFNVDNDTDTEGKGA